MHMKFADVRSGFKLAVVVNGCLFIAAMLSQSADLAGFVFSPAWMMGLLAICAIFCWLCRAYVRGRKEHT
jgi:hypothetical protein